MGIYNLDNPGRAGDDVAKYDGWMMMNILRDFRGEDLSDAVSIHKLKRAIMVSHEFRAVSKGARVNV